MTARLAILCPGQGGQHARMFELVRGMPRLPAAPDLATLERLLGRALPEILVDPQALFENRIAQPLVVAATVAMWEALRNEIPAPALVAGYSVGELSAYAVAGTLGPDQAVALAACRAEIMDACAAGGERQGLLAVSGLRAAGIAGELAADNLHVAIETGVDSFIVGGHATPLAGLAARIDALGGHATALPVAVASHTPLMQEATRHFARLLQDGGLHDPLLPVLSGISAERVLCGDAAIAALTLQMTQTIRWLECMDALSEAGITIALELGPGAALARMLRARHPHIEVRSVEDFRSVSGVSDWVARHFA